MMRPCRPWGATVAVKCSSLGSEPVWAHRWSWTESVEPMELGHLPYRKATYEDYVGDRGRERLGKKKWRKKVADVIARLFGALQPDEVVLGGGNVKKLKELPPHCREGDNANAFLGGFRLWEEASDRDSPSCR